jgi:sirohydrochlorin cobaltochelatase
VLVDDVALGENETMLVNDTKRKRAILLVAYGTSDEGATGALRRIEDRTAARFPGICIRWAYTSRFVRKRLQTRGRTVASPREALQQLVDEGYAVVHVQSLHVVAGVEFHGLAREIRRFREASPRLGSLTLGRPLLASRDALDRVVAAVWDAMRQPGEREQVVLVGHGHVSGRGDLAYTAADAAFRAVSPRILLGTLEGRPGLNDVLAHLRADKPETVRLVPFLVVPGQHVRRDLDENREGSWRSAIESLGIAVTVSWWSLAECGGVVDVWLDHIETCMAMETE